MKHIASDFEKEYNQIDQRILGKKEKKKLEKCLFESSRIVETNKLLMKTSRAVFSDVKVDDIVRNHDANNNYMCKNCTRSFESVFHFDNHKCIKKWICEKCGIDTRNNNNFVLHKEKGCRSRTCNKCREQFFNIDKYKEHKENCDHVICMVCKIVLKSLSHRYKHTRKCHLKSKK